MKNEGIIIFLVLLIISNILLWIVVISDNNAENVIVVIEEKTLNLIHAPLEEFCHEVCEEKGYDGWLGTGMEANPDSICDCYYKHY